MFITIDRVAGKIIRLVASVCVHVCVSVRLSVGALLIEPFDFWHEGQPRPWLARIVGQRSRSNSENCLDSPVVRCDATQFAVVATNQSAVSLDELRSDEMS